MRLKNFDKIAFYTSDDQAISYKEVMDQVAYYKTLFSIRKGDRAIIFSENRPEWIYSLYAIWYNDGIAVPADFSMPADDLHFIINNSKPKIIFCSKEGKTVVSKALKNSKLKPKIIILDSIKPLATKKQKPALPELPKPDADKTAIIIYTSGTTGNPKGVMLSFDNLLANIESIDYKKMIRKEHIILNLLPFHHILPLQGNILMPFYLGCTTVFIKSLEKEDIFNALQKHKVSMIIAVPRIYELFHNGIMTKLRAKAIARLLFGLAKLIKSEKFSRTIFKKIHDTFGGHINTCVSGGAKLDEEIAKNMTILGFRMIEGYGTSETAPMITFNPNEKVKIGSAGYPISNNKVKIVNNEIVVSGRNVMQGYYKNPTATKKVLKNNWYHTGDTGYLDKDGYLYITGRKDELIVLPNGKNINPEEIESSIIGMSPLIKEIGVIQNNGHLMALVYPDFTSLRSEDIVHAFETIRDRVIEKYNSTVANYKKIFKLQVVNREFPRTRLGKLKRFLLNDFLKKETKETKNIAEPKFQEYKMVKEFIENLKDSKVFHFTHLEYDANLDSLDKVELQAYIEKTFGITLDAKALTKNPTLHKLALLIKEQKTKIETDEVNWKTILAEKTDFKFSRKPGRFPFRKSMRRFFKRRFELTFEGLENLPPAPCILAPNHESYLDVLMLTTILPERSLFNTFFWTKDSPIMSRFVKIVAGNRNIIILNLEKDLKGSLQKSAAVLKASKNLLIFPEGTRSKEGELGDFKKAFAILSKELNIPIVPIAIKGAYQAMPRGRIFPKHGKISISILKPIKPGKLSYQALADKTRAAIKKML